MQTREQGARIYSRDTNLHGSARWASRAHFKSRKLGEHGDIFLGYGMAEHKGGRAYPITSSTKKHLITIAPTRSGKSVAMIVSRCLEHRGSLVVIDTKNGEIALICANHRINNMGRNVKVIDPWGNATDKLGIPAACFNPLDWFDINSEDSVEDAFLIADSLIMDRGVKDPYWSDEARALLMGLILYIKSTALVMLPTEKKSCDLAQVRRLLNLPPKKFREMVGGKFEEDEDGNLTLVQAGMAQSWNEHVQSAAARILNKAPKEFSSVLSTAQQNTHFLESPRIQKSLSRSDFTFEDLENGNLDIFIVLPAGRLWIYARFLRLLINLGITSVSRFESKPNPPVYFLLEEAAALGHMGVIENAFGLMAGLGMQLHMVFQDLSQLASIYGDRWQSFIANSGVIQCFGTRDIMTAEYLSKLCGVGTVESLSEYSAALRAGLFSDPNYLSRDDSVHSRVLITPDEIMTMPSSAQLLILSNAYPVICFKSAYFLDRRYRDKNGKPYFDIHPHYQDRPLPRAVDFTKSNLDIAELISHVMDEG
ncbi:MAG: type IV secretory system conjugative DNA transfer family protein [Immundisolibacteraceae bacterium]|nr:type IV secretory system conjugative DNA transfer family protein [Immundisolibacteraceae bacterium]